VGEAHPEDAAVEAVWGGDGAWYPAVVKALWLVGRDDEIRYDVRFDDGAESLLVAHDQIRRRGQGRVAPNE
jgi:hypothetical protein